MRIVADAAILVRTAAEGTGPATALLDHIDRGSAVLVLSPFIIDEVRRVLRYPRMRRRHQLSDARISHLISRLQSLGDTILPAEGPRIVPQDPNDDPIIYTAVAGNADFICTRDAHFYNPDVLAFCSRHGIQVMDEISLLRILREEPYNP